ncbi:MAG TPA: ATP-binding protein, partial [Kofleriaceae bacterium]|nr:ATP-binding protein [Kofleriaceae bacterium]
TFHEGAVLNYQLVLGSSSVPGSRVSFNAAVFRNTAGEVMGILVSARDVTQQTQLEQQIRDQNRKLTETTEFLNSVLESSTQHSIIAHDHDGTILTWNEGARQSYGYSSDEMIGKTFHMLYVPEDLESGSVDAFLGVARMHGKAEGLFEGVRKDGRRFTAVLTITLRRDASGNPAGYVMISKDVAKEKQLETQLRLNDELEARNLRVEAATRQKSEFLANMSHELRTPLNGIIGLAELMHDEKVGPMGPGHKEYLRDILTSSTHLMQLINDVLDLAKVESGKIEFHPEVVDVECVVAEVCDILRALSAQKHLHIACEIDPRVEQIVSDPSRLKQILYNFLSNALKFTPDGGRITVRALPEGLHDVRLEVADSGIGIRREDFEQLFVEFEQLDSGSNKKYAGTGLGLALTRRIVEAQGGHVGVDSAPATGSTFFAVLPRIARTELVENVRVA